MLSTALKSKFYQQGRRSAPASVQKVCCIGAGDTLTARAQGWRGLSAQLQMPAEESSAGICITSSSRVPNRSTFGHTCGGGAIAITYAFTLLSFNNASPRASLILISSGPYS
jgi:hypothetical protein